MKRSARVIVPVVFALLQIAPSAARAQQPGDSLGLHLALTRRLPAARLVPDPKAAEKDAEDAIAEIQARERRDELIRQLTEHPFRRPDLDRDVIGGIQSRNLNDALRRR